MNALTVSTHQAMNTWWQVRIAHEEKSYALQAAQAAFQVTDHLEMLFSKFRENSEVSTIATLAAGGRQRVSPSLFDCLSVAKKTECLTRGAFDVGFSQRALWHLDSAEHAFVAETGSCQLDLGAIGKGYALDQMAEELENWGCEKFLLLSSGSSILAGEPQENESGWAVQFGADEAPQEIRLARQSLSTSGFSMQPQHIINPATGARAERYQRTWAIAPSAAEADAFSTAWMNLPWDEIVELCGNTFGLSAGVLGLQNELLLTGEFCKAVN